MVAKPSLVLQCQQQPHSLPSSVIVLILAANLCIDCSGRAGEKYHCCDVFIRANSRRWTGNRHSGHLSERMLAGYSATNALLLLLLLLSYLPPPPSLPPTLPIVTLDEAVKCTTSATNPSYFTSASLQPVALQRQYQLPTADQQIWSKNDPIVYLQT